MVDDLSDLFEQQQEEFLDTDLAGATSPDDIFSIFEKYEDAATNKENPAAPFNPFEKCNFVPWTSNEEVNAVSVPSDGDEGEEEEADRARKKLKVSPQPPASEASNQERSQKMSHITVERNRRKQMNEHLSVLRSLMPSFYVKRGDQASIIGGVIDYIKELQQVLQSLEAKKQRKAYSSEVISPRPAVVSSSPRPSPLSPRPSPLSPRPSPLSPRPPPPLSPRMALPPTISPRTPQPGSPYIKPRLMQQSFIQLSPKAALVVPPLIISTHDHQSPPAAIDISGGGGGSLDQLAAAAAINVAKSPAADVEVKFSGPNVLLKTVSRRIPGQPLKIIAALDGLALEILHVTISTIDDTLLNSFTIKIGIECQLSAEELAQEIQQTFSA